MKFRSEIVCLQCGDVGFKNAFVYCVRCLKFVVHRYCLDVIPKSTTEFVRWLCDDCEAEKQNQHHLLKNDAIRDKTRDCTTSEHILGNCGTETRTKKNGIEHPAPQFYDPCAKINSVECSESDGGRQTVGLGMKDEAIIRSAADEGKGSEPSTSQLHEEKVNHSLDKPQKECTNIGFNERARSASDSIVSKDVNGIKPSLKRDHGLHHGPDTETTAALPPLALNSGSLGSSKKMKPDMPSAANPKDHVVLSAQHLKKQKGLDLGTPSADMTTARSNLSRESEVTRDRNHVSNHTSNSCNGFPKASTILPCTMSAEPIMDPIWRGSFNILFNNEDDTLEDVMAHMSRSACQKVHDEACQFKPVLNLEMLARAHVWPQSFEKAELVAGNIALYFFPSQRSEQFYDDLVGEMVDEDLALKAIVKNAELLVFPSTQLPLSYWRFQGKYFLWGVFRAKQPPKSGAPSCGRGSTYNQMMHRDSAHIATMKNLGGLSPLSPLSHCSSYGSHTL